MTHDNGTESGPDATTPPAQESETQVDQAESGESAPGKVDAAPVDDATPASTPEPSAQTKSEPASDSPESVNGDGEGDEEIEPPPSVTFEELGLVSPLLDAVHAMGWEKATPVQIAAFPVLCEGKDAIVQARTGSGKTGAFCLPWLASQFEAKPASETGVQLLVLLPTRELAKQVCNELTRLSVETKVEVLPVYGGTAMRPQLDALSAGVHAVVGTPGRVLDHIRRRSLDLSRVRTVVLDESDEMLSMGFLEDIRSILEACPRERQTCLFSATVPPDIVRIAKRSMRDPVRLSLSDDGVGAREVTHVYYPAQSTLKTRDLLDVVMVEDPTISIVFCNTREETRMVAGALSRAGYSAEALSSDLTQSSREKVMKQMREHKLRFLVATDIAARGIDISHVSHVINYSFPESAENYIHRTGRTGRAGRRGVAISLLSPMELGNFYLLQKIYSDLTFTERTLPPAQELADQRTEVKIDGLSAKFSAPVSPEWTAITRRLVADPRGEAVVAYLLSEASARAQTQQRRADSEDHDGEDDRPRYRDRERSRDSDRGRSRDRGGRGGRDSRGRDSRDGRGGRDGRGRGGRDSSDGGESESRDAREPRRSRGRSRGDRPQRDSDTAATDQGDQDAPKAVDTEAKVDSAPETIPVTDTAHDSDQGTGDTEARDAKRDSAKRDSAERDDSKREASDSGDDTETGDSAETRDAQDSDDEQPKKKRRRRRRRRRKSIDGDESSGEQTAGLTDSERDSADADASDSDGDDSEEKKGGRRRRRRRRRGRSGASAPVPPPPEKRVTQDKIIIDIDDGELEVVREEFGDIDELGDLTLKGRRRAVMDEIEDEMVLEDLSAEDAQSSSDEGDEGDDDAEGDDDGAEGDDDGTDGTEGDDDGDESDDNADGKAAESGEDEQGDGTGKKKRRRRRRRKKKTPPPMPELLAPPHKDFWELWAGKYTWKDFVKPEDSEPEPEPAPPPPKQVVAQPEPDEAGPFLRVSLNLGRSHGCKSADIRGLMKDKAGLSGRTVRDLTVRDTDSLFRVPENRFDESASAINGMKFEGQQLEFAKVDTPSVPLRADSDPTTPATDTASKPPESADEPAAAAADQPAAAAVPPVDVEVPADKADKTEEAEGVAP